MGRCPVGREDIHKLQALWELIKRSSPRPTAVLPGYIQDEQGALYVWNGLRYVLAPGSSSETTTPVEE